MFESSKLNILYNSIVFRKWDETYCMMAPRQPTGTQNTRTGISAFVSAARAAASLPVR
ncbi:MAG: hypothetical protein AB9861_18380 [Methanosarcina sp.]